MVVSCGGKGFRRYGGGGGGGRRRRGRSEELVGHLASGGAVVGQRRRDTLSPELRAITEQRVVVSVFVLLLRLFARQRNAGMDGEREAGSGG